MSNKKESEVLAEMVKIVSKDNCFYCGGNIPIPTEWCIACFRNVIRTFADLEQIAHWRKEGF